MTSSSNAHVLIVEARFYDDMADALLDGAKAALDEAGATYDIVTVPGALEIPAAIAMALDGGDNGNVVYDGYVALGMVIRGETYHFELVSNESGGGITRIALDFGIPVANAVLTTDSDDQAVARMTEKGRDAARVAIEMANLSVALEQLSGDDEDEDEEEEDEA